LKIINNNNLLHDKNSIKDAKCIEQLFMAGGGRGTWAPLFKQQKIMRKTRKVGGGGGETSTCLYSNF